MRTRFFCIAFCLMFLGQMTQASTFTYHWEIDETPSGQESVSLPEPIEVEIEDSGIKASLSNGAATKLASKYKIFLSPQWDSDATPLSRLRWLRHSELWHAYLFACHLFPSECGSQ